ncbi:MAG: 4Fe-4S binding protein [Holosporaceae bacterium]|jgi:Fe-S-cluster-containing hydrogenase component 2|nr:4Fe-4S binding protein [Holosporaceae bacterium]
MEIIAERCKRCLVCIGVCPVKAISDKDGIVSIDNNICLECGCCAAACPNQAIKY